MAERVANMHYLIGILKEVEKACDNIAFVQPAPPGLRV